MDEVFTGIGVGLATRLHHRTAGDAQSGVRADQVEVVDVVSVTVSVEARLDPGADVKLEFQAALAEAVHRPQAHFHDGFGDRAGIPEVRAVYDLELHCCCCWGMARPSSPITFAG